MCVCVCMRACVCLCVNLCACVCVCVRALVFVYTCVYHVRVCSTAAASARGRPTWEQRAASAELREDAAKGPHVDLAAVLQAQDDLGGPGVGWGGALHPGVGGAPGEGARLLPQEVAAQIPVLQQLPLLQQPPR